MIPHNTKEQNVRNPPILRLKLIVNCGPCADVIYKCLHSIRVQTYPYWHAIVTVDPCGDDTHARALEAAAGEPRISIRQNSSRQYAMRNLVEAIRWSEARPDDVIVVLDGDDWFATDKALAVIAATYARFNCWMTYGSWIGDRLGVKGRVHGRWPAYKPGTTNFRHTRWLATAVRTWKKWLWDLIDDRDLRDDEGNYFRVTEDQFTMIPMLEMSGTDRACHIPITLMVYNRSNPHACGKHLMAEMTRNGHILERRPPYARLAARPALVRPLRAPSVSSYARP
jgi:glycosyltransferase involved in cell wall biosynthesis